MKAYRRELKRNAAANRLTAIGGRITEAVRFDMPEANVTQSETTSNAPLIRIELPGVVYHVTVTKARP